MIIPHPQIEVMLEIIYRWLNPIYVIVYFLIILEKKWHFLLFIFIIYIHSARKVNHGKIPEYKYDF